MSEERQLGYSRRALRPSRQSLTDGGQQPDQALQRTDPDGTPAPRGPGRRRAADSPVDARPGRTGERQSQTRARERESLRVHKALAEEGNRKPPQARTRRQLRQQQLESGLSASGSSASTAERDQPESLSVEETRAARSDLIEQAKKQVSGLEAPNNRAGPRSVDMEVLAGQKRLAERAAVLNRRAQVQPHSAEQNQQQKPPPCDPAAAHNLAMVTPLEFVEVPGQEFPVMKPPTTTHVPVVTGGPVQRRPRRSSGATAEPGGDIVPVSANAAHGLDPLDRRTAGLARINGFTIIQMLIVAVGAIAVTVGLMMIPGG